MHTYQTLIGAIDTEFPIEPFISGIYVQCHQFLP